MAPKINLYASHQNKEGISFCFDYFALKFEMVNVHHLGYP